jgi:glycosyltransferase involved in cell wall biosynthesis
MRLSISVVIPTYNGARFIREAIASVLGQSVLPQEIIVVDDASTDATADCIVSAARTSPVPARLIGLGRNSGGPGGPINVGIGAASGELIAVLDQDDVFLPRKLEEEGTLLATRPDVSLVCSCSATTLDPEKVWQSTELVEGLRGVGEEAGGCLIVPGLEALRSFLDRGNYVLGYPGFMFRRADWSRKGGVDAGLLIASDYDLLCWLCCRGSMAFIPRVHYLRREHAANLCRRRTRMNYEAIRVMARYLRLQPALLRDGRLSPRLRDWFRGFAYWAREAHAYRVALTCHYLEGRVWGWSRPLLGMALKVPLWWLWHRVTRRPPRYWYWTSPT